MGRKKSRHQKKEPYEQGIIPSGKPEEIKIREFIPESTEDLGALVVGDAPRFESPGLGRLTFIGGPSIFGEEYFVRRTEEGKLIVYGFDLSKVRVENGKLIVNPKHPYHEQKLDPPYSEDLERINNLMAEEGI